MAGYPIVDVKVTLFDGRYHEMDSNDMGLKIAGSIAFKEATKKASPVLLEPVMAVEVACPMSSWGAHMRRPSSPKTGGGLAAAELDS